MSISLGHLHFQGHPDGRSLPDEPGDVMSVELIAEIATNHGGSMGLAKEFIWRFAEAGADWVKFQHTRVKHLRPDDPQYEWFTRSELSLEQFQELKAECDCAGTKFLTTVYNYQDVPEVQQLGLQAIKIGSGEANDDKLAAAIVRARFRATLVATGLTPMHQSAIWRLAMENRPFSRTWDGLLFLGCVTRYPAPVGLAAVAFDRQGGVCTTGPQCYMSGWSDHAIGLNECLVAIVSGATIIEKHVQLSNQARPHKPWEATVEEFKQLRAFANEEPTRFLGRWQQT